MDPGPDDHDTWQRLQTVLRQEAAEGPAGATAPDAEEVARRAQEWRLPVTPYRMIGRPAANPQDNADHHPQAVGTALDTGRDQHERRNHGRAQHDPNLDRRRDDRTRRGTGAGPLAGVTVVDLTVLWAGPLATWLLAGLGARVIKIEPAARPDGLRRGERAVGAGPGDGAMFVALDHGKTHARLDLRRPTDHARFLELISAADIVIDNFSRRVRPNLGIEPERLRRVQPRLIDLSLGAFDPLGPQADWVAHGGGVHAASGLAATAPDGSPQPALVSYPDPVAGFSAFEVLVAALHAHAHAHADLAPPMVLSLEQAIRPLARRRAAPQPSPHNTRTRLGEWAMAASARADVTVDGCRVLPSPLRAVQNETVRP